MFEDCEYDPDLKGLRRWDGSTGWPLADLSAHASQFRVGGPQYLDVKATYGAKGDCQVVYDAAMTAASAVLTSASNRFTPADVGKAISVEGAAASGWNLEATILSYQGAGQVTLSVSASTTVSGQVAYWGTDDTAAIQAAINAAIIQNRNGSVGTSTAVFFPAAMYMVAGPLQAAPYNSQLTLPRFPFDSATNAPVAITLLGDGMTNTQWDVNAVGAGYVPSTQGSIIYTTKNASGLSNLAAFIGAGDINQTTFSNITVRMKDLTVRTPTKTNLTAINLFWAGACLLDNVVVDIAGKDAVDNSGNAWSNGIAMPSVNNGVTAIARACSVLGQQAGLLAAEHTYLDDFQAMKCARGVQSNGPQNHAWHFTRIAAQHCQHALFAGGTGTVGFSGGQLDVERDPAAPNAFVDDVADPASIFKAWFTYQSITSGTGAGNALTVSGATGVTGVRLR